MDSIAIENRCCNMAEDLLEKYFPNFVCDAAQTRPEELGGQYSDALPHQVETEFRDYLSGVWKEISPEGGKTFEEIMSRHLEMSMVDAEYVPCLKEARADAEQITLWEKITQSNHRDVTYYKGLLRQYTRELLMLNIKDFMEDVRAIEELPQ